MKIVKIFQNFPKMLQSHLKLSVFLSHTRSLFLSISSLPKLPPNKFYFILGNESADIDSIIGSICLAYHKYHNNESNSLDFGSPLSEEVLFKSPEKFYIPIINCPKEEINTRFDWNYISNIMEITQKNLIFFEELRPLLEKSSCDIILFDHNSPAKSQEFIKPLVREIIDHHEDLNVFPTEQITFKILKKAGSCCSILAEYIENSAKKLEKIDTSLVFGLFTTILLDTLNFDPKLKENRWVQQDFEIFCRLHARLLEHQTYNALVQEKNLFYKSLLDLKYSIKENLSLSLNSIFNKDMKTFFYGYGNVVFTSIFVCPFRFLEHYGVENINCFVAEKLKNDKLLSCLFLFVYPEEGKNEESLNRDLLVFSLEKKFVEKLEESFQEKKMKIKKRAVPYKFNDFPPTCCGLYSDEEKVYSRKLIEPIISKLKLN